MFKFIVVALVLIWLIGLFLGRKRRLIRSTSQLVQLLLWACFCFLGATAIPRASFFEGRTVLTGIALAVWIPAMWWVSRHVVRILDRK